MQGLLHDELLLLLKDTMRKRIYIHFCFDCMHTNVAHTRGHLCRSVRVHPRVHVYNKHEEYFTEGESAAFYILTIH